jgi:hypothetical protein
VSELWVWLILAIYASSAYPLLRGWWANRRTSLNWTFAWLTLAWLIPFVLGFSSMACEAKEYLYFVLVACVVVSLLGAKHPASGFWNLVVVAFLVVKLLPLIEESMDAAGWRLDPMRQAFLAIVLLVGILNHLPTRLGPWMLLAATGMVFSTETFVPNVGLGGRGRFLVMWTSLAASCWGVYLTRPRATGTANSLWLSFRDRYGVIWALRVKEQFNAAAKHAGHKAQLDWWGLVVADDVKLSDEIMQELEKLLRAVLRPFDGEAHLPQADSRAAKS